MGHRVYAPVGYRRISVLWPLLFSRRFFAKKFQSMLEAAAAKKTTSMIAEATRDSKQWTNRFLAFFTRRKLSVIDEEKIPRDGTKPPTPPKLRPDMIRRMDDAPKLVNPSGLLSEGHAPSGSNISAGSSHPQPKPNPSDASSSSDIRRSKLNRRRTISIDMAAPKYVRAFSPSDRIPNVHF